MITNIKKKLYSSCVFTCEKLVGLNAFGSLYINNQHIQYSSKNMTLLTINSILH